MKTKEEIISYYYQRFFNSLCYTGLQKSGSTFLHKSLESYWTTSISNNFKILELGAGGGEHFPFVDLRDSREVKYYAVDIDDRNFVDFDMGSKNSLVWAKGNVEKLDFADKSFDRVLATCLMLHVDNPFEALKEIRRVTKVGGEISLAYPCSSGFLLSLFKYFYTYPKARKLGLTDIDLVYALEHPNDLKTLLTLQKHVFSEDKLKNIFLPFKFRSINFNILVIAKIIKFTD
jgi:phosphatidylethanolamine/phosphatidyl-N-methylethanolamine N-methyltransferase